MHVSSERKGSVEVVPAHHWRDTTLASELTPPMSALHDIVLTRLADSGHANASWALLLLAALDDDGC